MTFVGQPMEGYFKKTFPARETINKPEWARAIFNSAWLTRFNS